MFLRGVVESREDIYKRVNFLSTVVMRCITER